MKKMKKPALPDHLTEKALAERQAKAERTRRYNEADRLILKYSKAKDWTMVIVQLVHTGHMMERGEI
jgi:hypothetical protein